MLNQFTNILLIILLLKYCLLIAKNKKYAYVTIFVENASSEENREKRRGRSFEVENIFKSPTHAHNEVFKIEDGLLK